MKKLISSIAFAVLCFSVSAQTTPTQTTTTAITVDKNCMAMADEQTWSTLGLNPDQVRRVKEIQTRYKGAMHMDRGTENTVRGTSDDRATPETVTDRTTGTKTTSGTDRPAATSENAGSTAATPSTDRNTVNTPGNDRAGTAASHGMDKTGTSGKTSDQLGYDDTNNEAMERELRTVLTTQQFDRYQEWCQENDATRGGRDDMDR